MRPTSSTLLAVALLAAATACFTDPAEDLRAGPARVVLSRSVVQSNLNDTTLVNIQVFDNQGNALPLSAVSFASSDGAVATMEPLPDSSLRDFPGAVLTKAIVIAGTTPGVATLTVTANGLSDTISTITYPPTFGATMAQVGDTLAITANGFYTFGPAATATFPSGAGLYGFVDRTATRLRYIAGVSGGPSPATISGGVMLGTIPLPSPLPTTGTITLAETTGEPGNDGVGTGPTITLPATVGQTVTVYGSVSSTDTDDIFNIVAATGDSVEVTLDWTGSHDVDLLVTNAAASSCLFGCAGATAANPEVQKARLVGGTTYRVIAEWFAGAPTPIAYRLRITKRA